MYFSTNCAYLYIEIIVVLVVDILLVGASHGQQVLCLKVYYVFAEHIISKRDCEWRYINIITRLYLS